MIKYSVDVCRWNISFDHFNHLNAFAYIVVFIIIVIVLLYSTIHCYSFVCDSELRNFLSVTMFEDDVLAFSPLCVIGRIC